MAWLFPALAADSVPAGPAGCGQVPWYQRSFLEDALPAGYNPPGHTTETLELWRQDYSILVADRLSNMWTKAIEAGPKGQPILDGLAFEFNTQTPGIFDWLKERGANFVTACTQEQQDAIAALLTKKMRESHTVDELARLIRPCIGLTEGQAKANARYYDSIVANLSIFFSQFPDNLPPVPAGCLHLLHGYMQKRFPFVLW